MAPILRPVALSQLSDVQCEFSLAQCDDGVVVLVVAFRGEYRTGSSGNPDARAMAAQLHMAIAAWNCDALVLDCAQLSYVWGDSFLQLFEVDTAEWQPPLPRTVRVGDRSRAGLQSLLAAGGLFDELEPAIEAAAGFARELRALDRRDEELPMYILLRDSLAPEHAVVAAAHAAMAAYECFQKSWEMRAWMGGSFRKVVCQASEEQFAEARQVADHVAITEAALGNQVVALAFRPRAEWPESFRFLRPFAR